ncbi:MAG: hypothetical protein JW703_03370 [Candidatus Diapherotrites archaeon]|nr:hypothetical protein [Candidatus Diapherotrites archaeon]
MYRKASKLKIKRITEKINQLKEKISLKFPEYRKQKASGTENAIHLAETARIKKTDILLDPFGGPGFSSVIAMHFNPKKIITVDYTYSDKSQPNPNELQKELNTPKKIFPIAGNSESLPLKTASIDKIISCPPYNYRYAEREKQEKVIEKIVPELKRVLKKNSTITLIVPVYWELRFMPFMGFDLQKEIKLDEKSKIMHFKTNNK